MTARALLLGSALVLVAGGAWLVIGQYTRAAAVLVLGAELDGPVRAVVRLHERPVADQELTIPTREGPLRALAYRPAGATRRPLVLITGVHPAGIDEPRLQHFARSLAAVGIPVVTPELRRLFDFEITPQATDAIEDVTAWVSSEPDWGAGGAIGIAGISFSGGLAIVAAGRPAITDRVAFVLSIGGHGDLLRTLETLAGDALTEAGAATADVVGLTIVLTAVAHHVVPAEQVSLLRTWGRLYLEAAHLPLEERAHRQELFARADVLARALPEPSGSLVRHALGGNAAALRPSLLMLVRELAGDPALSPERAPAPTAPVYLLHGAEDEVIPADEARRLSEHLHGRAPVRLLVTPALTHADVMQHVGAADGWQLVRFLASALRR